MARRLEVEVIADVDRYRRGLKKADDSTESFGHKLKGMGKAAGLAAGAAALGGVVVALKASFSAAKDAEQAQVRLTQAFKSANVPTSKQARAMEEVNRVSRRAALDDEDLSDVLARLTRSTGDVDKATRGMALAAEIARGRNVSLEAASKAVEKAYLGNDQALKRLGVTVPKTADNVLALKDNIEALKDRMEGATAAEKLAIEAKIESLQAGMKNAAELDKQATATAVLEKATKQFAGSAEAYGKTAAGAQDRLSVAFENLQERIGQKLLPVFVKLSEQLLRLIVWAEREWPKFERAVGQGIEKAKRVFEDFRPVLEALAKQIENIVKFVAALIRGDWSEAWEKFKDIIAGAVTLAMAVFREWGEKMEALARKIGEALKDGIVAGLKGLGEAVLAILRGTVNLYIRMINKVIDKINDLLSFKIKGPGPLPDIGFDAPNLPKIPELKRGGITTRDTLAFLHKDEAVVPLSGPHARGAVGMTVVINAPNYVGSKDELMAVVRQEFAKLGRRGVGPLPA